MILRLRCNITFTYTYGRIVAYILYYVFEDQYNAYVP